MLEWFKVLLMTTTLATVVDGDTVRLANGQGVRLTGFNAPEIFSPKCEAEKKLGLRAKARLIELLRDGAKLTITEGHCAYGRLCGSLSYKGETVGAILIREGLAEPMVCPRGKCPRPRDWCAAP